jgi:hypothetical protein
MRQSYSHLLTFLFRHRYFRENLFKSIGILYADGTPKLIKDLGIIIKPFSGGFHLLASDPELLGTITDQTPLQFHLFCNDSQYVNYTDLPLYRLSDKLLYFNNITPALDKNNNGFSLQKEEFVGQNEVVQISQGKINIPETGSDQQYRFTNASGFDIPSQCIYQSTLHNNQYTITGISQNLVRILIGNTDIYKVYFNPKPIWLKPLGIVELFPEILYSQFKEHGKVEYIVSFNNRQTIWKYFLVSPVYQKFNNLSIINKGKEQIFSVPQKQAVFKNPEAWVIESKIRIPLSEFTEEAYQLVDNYDSEKRTGKVILKNLARATPDQLHFDTTKPEASAYSHIYL